MFWFVNFLSKFLKGLSTPPLIQIDAGAAWLR
jgi:hypothetical protein